MVISDRPFETRSSMDRMLARICWRQAQHPIRNISPAKSYVSPAAFSKIKRFPFPPMCSQEIRLLYTTGHCLLVWVTVTHVSACDAYRIRNELSSVSRDCCCPLKTSCSSFDECVHKNHALVLTGLYFLHSYRRVGHSDRQKTLGRLADCRPEQRPDLRDCRGHVTIWNHSREYFLPRVVQL